MEITVRLWYADKTFLFVFLFFYFLFFRVPSSQFHDVIMGCRRKIDSIRKKYKIFFPKNPDATLYRREGKWDTLILFLCIRRDKKD